MGVKHIWSILSNLNKKINIKKLKNKKVAIDISIWLYQFNSIKNSKNNISDDNFILLGIFHRILKLLYYDIKPIFVFDGIPPHLKARELKNRQKIKDNSDKIIQNMAKKLLSQPNIINYKKVIHIKNDNIENDKISDYNSDTSSDGPDINIPFSFAEKRLYNTLNKDEKSKILNKVELPQIPLDSSSNPEKFSETQLEWLQYRNEIRQNIRQLKGIDYDDKIVKRFKQTGETYEYERYKIDNSIFEDNKNKEEEKEKEGYGFLPDNSSSVNSETSEIDTNNLSPIRIENNHLLQIDVSPISSSQKSTESGWESISVSPSQSRNNTNIISNTISDSINTNPSTDILTKSFEDENDFSNKNTPEKKNKEEIIDIEIEESEMDEDEDNEMDIENKETKENPFPVIYRTFIDDINEKENSNNNSFSQSITDLDESFSEVQEDLPVDIKQKVIEMLEVFGLPYIISPGEAEAQCAFLVLINII